MIFCRIVEVLCVKIFTKERTMGLKVGLWIDHRKAIIIKLTDQGESIELIESRVERQLRRSGESPLRGPFDTLQVPPDDVRQRAFMNQINAYYDGIIADIQSADAILIMGPGEGVDELKKRMEKSSLAGKIAAIEKVGRMTRRQIAARVRQYFKE
jgi:hypothetical protein